MAAQVRGAPKSEYQLFIMQEENRQDTICIWKTQSRVQLILDATFFISESKPLCFSLTVIDKLIFETIFSYLKREIRSLTLAMPPF